MEMGWNVKEIRMEVSLEKHRKEKPWLHSVQMVATMASADSIRCAKAILGWPIEDLPIYKCISSPLKCLFYNCRGAGNDDFKITTRDIYREHEPEVVAILGTKVPYSNMGFFLDEFGLTSSSISNPIRKGGGDGDLVTLEP